MVFDSLKLDNWINSSEVEDHDQYKDKSHGLIPRELVFYSVPVQSEAVGISQAEQKKIVLHENTSSKIVIT